MKIKTGISPKWSKFAEGWIEDKYGRHCHWCKSANFETDGEVYCDNTNTWENLRNIRIRTWAGTEVAKKCKCFGLSDWYKNDANYDKTFSKQ